ncbi:hypothetical protein OsI_33724 [Oryza sativa Indica Group]|uniref:Uncharacterized protein n=1 Tax=Oryza sativa subsp. indica TaxID=39946 RepID=A2Z7P0_ORYSI|nr:hypothetical protein OsI_33724 [Oryza sativa Indica Group]
MSKEEGGLGIRDLKAHNLSLLMKLASKLLSGSPEPCFHWLRAQHLQNEIPILARPTDTPNLPLASLQRQVKLQQQQNAQKWSSDPHCNICPAIESADHIVLRCKLAEALWTKLGLNSIAIQCTDILQFVDEVLGSSQGHLKLGWLICFAACAHNLWKARNDAVFN